MSKNTAAGNLAQQLENGTDWQVVKTSIPGVFVQTMPGNKSRDASLCVIVNPADEDGKATKRRHLYMRNPADISAYKGIFSDPKLKKLMGLVAVANGAVAADEDGDEISIEI